jgi:hypothetical protein
MFFFIIYIAIGYLLNWFGLTLIECLAIVALLFIIQLITERNITNHYLKKYKTSDRYCIHLNKLDESSITKLLSLTSSNIDVKINRRKDNIGVCIVINGSIGFAQLKILKQLKVI